MGPCTLGFGPTPVHNRPGTPAREPEARVATQRRKCWLSSFPLVFAGRFRLALLREAPACKNISELHQRLNLLMGSIPLYLRPESSAKNPPSWSTRLRPEKTPRNGLRIGPQTSCWVHCAPFCVPDRTRTSENKTHGSASAIGPCLDKANRVA